ncbi:reverse transcriptase domain-containing protein [Tanacetum coccineum]
MRTRNSNFPNNSNVTIPRRQNKGRAPNIVEPELRTIVAPMAERTMEELLRAPTEGYGEAIVLPKINADHFEIKTNLLQLVQANPFHGLENENPHAHINSFKRITSTLRFRNVPNDVIKLMMFPYSLEGAAKTWYEKEPPNSILTWEDLVTKFVNQFFPPSSHALSKKLDWENPKGGDYLCDLSKPLPLITRGKRIEDMVPNIWRLVKVAYDKYALWGISNWREQRKSFYAFARVMQSRGYVYSTKRILAVTREGDFPRLWINDIEDILLLVVQNRLTNLSGDDGADFAIALRMFTRSLVIQKRVEDLQLGVESYQKKINVTKPDTTRPDLRKRHPYTPYKDPQGFIYVDDYKRNRLMRSDELYKFSDGMLIRLLSSLEDITKNIDREYLPKRRWSTLEKKRDHFMIKDINKLLKERRMMRSLDKFVGERFDTSAGNPVKEILLKLNLPDHRIFKDGGEVRVSWPCWENARISPRSLSNRARGKNRLIKVVRSSSQDSMVPSLSSSNQVFASPEKDGSNIGKNKESVLADIESESDVDEVYNETASFMASKSGGGGGAGMKSLYECWKDDYDPYDEDYMSVGKIKMVEKI